MRYPAETRQWLDDSNFIVVLAVPDEEELLAYADAAWKAEHPYHVVFEPDVESHTAVVFGPGAFCQRFASLPLALREAVMA